MTLNTLTQTFRLCYVNNYMAISTDTVLYSVHLIFPNYAILGIKEVHILCIYVTDCIVYFVW